MPDEPPEEDGPPEPPRPAVEEPPVDDPPVSPAAPPVAGVPPEPMEPPLAEKLPPCEEPPVLDELPVSVEPPALAEKPPVLVRLATMPPLLPPELLDGVSPPCPPGFVGDDFAHAASMTATDRNNARCPWT